MQYPTMLEVALSYERGAKAVTEASLARVMGLADKVSGGAGSFGILTSWRAAKTPEQNEANFKALQQAVRMHGLGFRKLIGHWVECQNADIPYKQCPPDQLKDSTEPSLFVFGISEDQTAMLSKKYEQDAWIYAGPETDGKVALYFRDGGKDILGNWQPGALEQAYSQLYRRKSKKVFRNLQVTGGDAPAFTFTGPKETPLAMAAESKQLKFVELRAESFPEGLLFAKHGYLREAMLHQLTESRQTR